MSTLRIVGEDDVRRLIDTAGALYVARRILRDQAAGGSYLSTPSAMSLDARRYGSGRFKFKAATVAELGMSGIRLISRRTATDPTACNWCALYAHGGLELVGLVAERWLSRIRTAAFGAASIEALVKPGRLTVALFGTGSIAHEIMPMLAAVLPIERLRVCSRRAESMAAFAARHQPACAFPIVIEPDGDRMVDGADVIITLTEASAPLWRPRGLVPGALVCSMGGNHEVDIGVLHEAQRLVVDDVDFAAEVGDGAAWIEQGHFTRTSFEARVDATACEVVAEKKPARHAPDDRVVAIIQGMAVGDVALAAYALQQAQRAGIGTTVEMP